MKALTTRVPLMFSWMTPLRLSILPCSRLKSGLVFQRMNPMSRSTSGKAQAMITRKCTLRDISVIVPTTMNIRHRIKPRTSCETSRSTCETSLVTRVMSEPVVKASVCSNERCMIRSKHFLRILLPKFWLHRLAMVPLSMPNRPPARTMRIIRIPTVRIRARSGVPSPDRPRMPLSTMSAMSRGWIISTVTSAIMKPAARMAKIQYLRM